MPVIAPGTSEPTAKNTLNLNVVPAIESSPSSDDREANSVVNVDEFQSIPRVLVPLTSFAPPTVAENISLEYSSTDWGEAS